MHNHLAVATGVMLVLNVEYIIVPKRYNFIPLSPYLCLRAHACSCDMQRAAAILCS